jgi:hypothetical protein
MNVHQIERRWCEVESQLQALRELRVVQGTDPASREGELLEEMDALEYEAGLLYFGEREPVNGRGAAQGIHTDCPRARNPS